MRYLILSPTGKPLEEINDLEEARERIAGTCDVVKYILETDDEPSDLCYGNGSTGQEIS